MPKPIVIPPGSARSSATRRIGASRSSATATSCTSPGRDSARPRRRRAPRPLPPPRSLLRTRGRPRGQDRGRRGDRRRRGTLVCIPPLVVHGFRNAGDVEVKFLNLHAPGCGFIDYMRGLRDQAHRRLRPARSRRGRGDPAGERDRLGRRWTHRCWRSSCAPSAQTRRKPSASSSFYVPEGEPTLELDQGTVDAPTGVGVQVEPLNPLCRLANGEARHLALSAASSHPPIDAKGG